MAAPVWQAPVPGQPGNAGLANQFLTAHPATYAGAGTLRSSGGNGTGVYTSTAGQYLAQQFVMAAGQVTLGFILLQVSAVGGSALTSLLGPLTVSVYAADEFTGGPSGSALIQLPLPDQYVYAEPFWVLVPLVLLAPSGRVFWIVTSPQGTSSRYYAWQQSASGSGAMTSPDGVTWTAASYGLMYQVFDLAGGLPLQAVSEDNGARLTRLFYGLDGALSGIVEWTAASDGTFLYQSRTVAYNGQVPAGVS